MWRSFFQMREVLIQGLRQVNVSSLEALQQTVDSLILVRRLLFLVPVIIYIYIAYVCAHSICKLTCFASNLVRPVQ